MNFAEELGMQMCNELNLQRFKPKGLIVSHWIGATYFTLDCVSSIDSEELFADILFNPVSGEAWRVWDLTRTRVFESRGRYIFMAYMDKTFKNLNSVTSVEIIPKLTKVRRPTIREADAGWFVQWRTTKNVLLADWCFSIPDQHAKDKADRFYAAVLSAWDQQIKSGYLREA